MFSGKGRGVVTKRSFQRGEFVTEYAGDLITISVAKDREIKYAADHTTGCFMYFFTYNGQNYW